MNKLENLIIVMEKCLKEYIAPSLRDLEDTIIHLKLLKTIMTFQNKKGE